MTLSRNGARSVAPDDEHSHGSRTGEAARRLLVDRYVYLAIARQLAAFTFVRLALIVKAAACRSRAADHVLKGSAELVIENGQVDRVVMRRFMLSDEALRSMLEGKGLRIGEVRRAYLAPNGSLTIFRAG